MLPFDVFDYVKRELEAIEQLRTSEEQLVEEDEREEDDEREAEEEGEEEEEGSVFLGEGRIGRRRKPTQRLSEYVYSK